MPKLHAFCREVSPALADCELSFIGREPIDVANAQAQHAGYVAQLRAWGVTVIELPDEPALPDSVFVEDTVLMFDELAVITRPGADSRRAEVPSIEAALRPYRDTIAHILAPGTLDGGDVLCVQRQVFVGLSRRSSPAAIEQLGSILAPYGYTVTAVPMRDCLHLKSAVTALSDDTFLINPDWVEAAAFARYRCIAVDAGEPHAANVLRVGQRVLMPRGFPRTQALIEQAGFEVAALDMSELQKAEGAVTCCSVLFRV